MSVDPIDRHPNARDGNARDGVDSLTHALSSLPAQRPPRDGWERLRAELVASNASPRPTATPRPRLRRRSRWLAVAAVLALTAITLRWQSLDPVAPPSVEVPVMNPLTASSRSDALIDESARLESVLAWMAPGARSAEALALDVSLIDRLQWIDHLLADPHASDATREVLWSERVDLMTQRVALSQRESLVAMGNSSPQNTL